MIFAIESSCDESALAIFDPLFGVVKETVFSQELYHQRYGGVVPDLASRSHLERFPTILKPFLENVNPSKIDLIAYTGGPGLVSCLAMGQTLAKTLSWLWNRPLISVNHLSGHVYSPFINKHRESPCHFNGKIGKEYLPHLGLLVSGGNTLLFEINLKHQIEILAETIDDAAGEALDKGAKLLGLTYPGGKKIEQLAIRGDPYSHSFPKAFQSSKDWKFSFSGIKTSLRYLIEKINDSDWNDGLLEDLCASYQKAILTTLVNKFKQALKKKSYKSAGLSGGVANNRKLRQMFIEITRQNDILPLLPDSIHTGDNASMIAFSAWITQESNVKFIGSSAKIKPVWPLSN